MAESTESRSLWQPGEAAAYIEASCAEMSRIAARSDLRLLAYLLDVAREEAATRKLDDR